MATLADLTPPAAPQPVEPATGTGWARFRVGLLLTWIGLLAALVAVGERPGRLSDLQAAIATGEVRTVEVVGWGLPGDATGYSVQELHWREGLLGRTADVMVRSSAAAVGDDATAVAAQIDARDAGTYLQRDHPDLRVVRAERTSTADGPFGWRLPSWLWGAAFLHGIAALWLLVHGPQPWRASRWGWFWLVFLAPGVGVPAFLLLSGRPSIVSAPHPSSRRLSGGWAFLLAALLATL